MSKEFQIRDGNLIASFDLENEDGDIDFCKLLKVSHGVADEIGMFVDYVATNKIIKDQSKKIADLETKLAESENNHELLIDQFEEETEKLRKQIKQKSDARERFVVEVKSLKQKLAEKDEEIKQLNNRILFSQLQAPNEQILNILGSQCVQYNPNQDKISFAVEQLEQLKKLCQEKFNWWENSEWEGNIYDKSDVSNAYFDIEANIDNQIKAIKGEK